MPTTVSINNTSVRVLSVKGGRVHRWGSAALEPGLVRDGLITQPEAVGQAISSLLKSVRVSGERVTVSINTLPVTYRLLNLPRLKGDALEEAVRRSFSREISLPLEELYISWQALPGEGEELTCFVAGVSRSLVDALAQTLQEIGDGPHVMDIQPLALARAARRSPAIIVGLETDSYDITIVASGLPVVMHAITPRGEGSTLEDNIRRLADELTKTISFYQNNHPDAELTADTPLLLTGELAGEPAAPALLQTMTDYAIEPLTPTLKQPADIPTAAYAVNMGLALKKPPPPKPGKESVGYRDVSLNLLAAKYRKPKAPPRPLKPLIITAGLAVALLLLYPLYQGQARLAEDNLFLESRLQRLQHEVNLAGLSAWEADQAENILDDMENYLEVIRATQEELLGARGEYTENLEEITGVIPANLYLTAVNLDSEEITIDGEADSVFTVVAYAAALEEGGTFEDVNISQLDEDTPINPETGEKEGETFIVFTITVTR